MKSKKAVLAVVLAVVMSIAVMVLIAGCALMNLKNKPDTADQKTEQQESAVEVPETDDVPEEVEEQVKAVVPPEDFDPVGEYEDDMSQRAMMTITPEGDEDHYVVEISWGSSAFETTIWEFQGDFNRESGMLAYNNCSKYELTVDENGEQHEKEIYKNGKGALLYNEDGFSWKDKREDAGKGCHFTKTDDYSDAIIEEDDE